ncbi:hypothetical protein [Chengkuizengella axinellae]|uniref:Spore coat protein n=1 Tax=Chengkuizengella axinellae TaxID=3064388 RepID=A0ABT9IYM4_9BACL|nr:hypothetical protein [Chengkuizengella sp. 2205SS18-9]MDP5274464.1 hypothetical protein [Chengkuizengella sp. 2205SS18-9]
MGVFDKSLCDCCVCPMQCVLEQLIDIPVLIFRRIGSSILTTISEVDNFIAFTDQGKFPICNITAITIPDGATLNLKPIKKNTGECFCCEDPITNLASTLIDQVVEMNVIGIASSFEISIVDVGEGIILTGNPVGTEVLPISSCAITRINSINQQQINSQN